jgi:small subunit ribosomal protein S20
LRNTMFKSSMKSAIKKFEVALTTGNADEAKSALNFAIKKIDMAASKGILHKNAADRKKSQLAVKFNKTIAS